MGEWRYSSTILDLGTGWRWVASFTLLPFYPGERTPTTHWIGGWAQFKELRKINVTCMNKERFFNDMWNLYELRSTSGTCINSSDSNSIALIVRIRFRVGKIHDSCEEAFRKNGKRSYSRTSGSLRQTKGPFAQFAPQNRVTVCRTIYNSSVQRRPPQ
jgi:hypothetical protein